MDVFMGCRAHAQRRRQRGGSDIQHFMPRPHIPCLIIIKPSSQDDNCKGRIEGPDCDYITILTQQHTVSPFDLAMLEVLRIIDFKKYHQRWR